MRSGTFRGFVIVIMVATGALLGLPAPALATCSVDGQGWGVFTYPGSQHQYGVKVASNLVVNPSTTCQIVRSLYVRDNGTNFVEVGWYEDDGPGGRLSTVTTLQRRMCWFWRG